MADGRKLTPSVLNTFPKFAEPVSLQIGREITITFTEKE